MRLEHEPDTTGADFSAQPLPAVDFECRESYVIDWMRTRSMQVLWSMAASFAIAAGCAHAPEDSADPAVLVFAAASLRDALTQIGADYARTASHPDVRFSFAGSNALALQLEAAPRADLFVSASDAWMDRLEQHSRIVPETRRPLLGNALVAIAHHGAELDAADVCSLREAAFDHLVLGDPEVVPAGVYAREYLQKLRCADGHAPWTALSARVLPMPDVRAALGQVERRRGAVGIVYRTDARTSSRIRVLFEVRGETAPKIEYPAALVARVSHASPAQDFLDFLAQPSARSVFEEQGFVVLDPHER